MAQTLLLKSSKPTGRGVVKISRTTSKALKQAPRKPLQKHVPRGVKILSVAHVNKSARSSLDQLRTWLTKTLETLSIVVN